MTNATTVNTLPDCDLCRFKGKTSLARYDAATTLGSWAFLCEAHFSSHGLGLGTGRGQRLELTEARA